MSTHNQSVRTGFTLIELLVVMGIKGGLTDYSVTSGKDAIGEVSARVAFETGTKIVTGKGASTDIIEASALAYLNALKRYLDDQRRRAETDKPTQ